MKPALGSSAGGVTSAGEGATGLTPTTSVLPTGMGPPVPAGDTPGMAPGPPTPVMPGPGSVPTAPTPGPTLLCSPGPDGSRPVELATGPSPTGGIHASSPSLPEPSPEQLAWSRYPNKMAIDPVKDESRGALVVIIGLPLVSCLFHAPRRDWVSTLVFDVG